ncbi:hypothetical protein LCGC14_1027260 [marine sediment metagenome]|uniref:Uncharacterized protein n=1 Tax=marine sediment metagenome TaxID=412755 RepID=A0A0F9QDV2_9ZZZZ
MKRPETKKQVYSADPIGLEKHNKVKAYNKGRQDMIDFQPSYDEILRIMDNLMAEGKGILEYAKAIHRRLGGK